MSASDFIEGGRLALAPEIASIRQAGDWLQKIATDLDVPPQAIARLDLCLHEVLANILAHGAETALARDIVVDLRILKRQAEGEVELEIEDAGMAFDPLSRPLQSSAQSLHTVEPGGLGIVMIRSHSDRLEYRREHGLNHLRIGVIWKHTDP